MYCTFRYADGTVEEHNVQLVHSRVPAHLGGNWEQRFPYYWTLNRRRIAAPLPFDPGPGGLDYSVETVRFVCRAFKVRDEFGLEVYFHEYHEESACPGPFCQCMLGPKPADG